MGKLVARVVDIHELQEGIFIPKSLFGGAEELEMIVSSDQSVTIRPRRRSRADVRKRIDARREALRARFGQMSDSSVLIRQFRDGR